jgi:hypothetical protein
MRTIKVVTNNGNAYYYIVSRLKMTHLRYYSHQSGPQVNPVQDLVVTSRSELPRFGGDAVAIEDLDEDPLVLEGQLLSRLLDEAKRDLLVGIDPGSTIGEAVFYGGRGLGTISARSVERSVEWLLGLVNAVPHSSLSVKIGGGEPKSSQQLARLLRERLERSALIEIVDESGTSVGRRGAVGATRDQRAAARIAFRKGSQFDELVPRKRTAV